MKRPLLLVLLLLALPGLVCAQVAVVQHASAQSATSVTSIGVAPTSNITTSNYLLVTCGWYTTGETVTVTDNASGGSNTYADTGSGAIENSTGGTAFVRTFKAKIVNGGGTKPTISCNFTSSNAFVDILIHEISGASSTTFVDAFASATPNPSNTYSTPNIAGSIATSSAVDLIYAVCAPESNNLSNGPGYLQLESTADGLVSEVGLTNTTVSGTYLPLEMSSAANNMACNVVAIKAANQTAAPGVSINNSWVELTDTSSTTRSWSHTTIGGSTGVLYVTLHWRNTQSGVAPTVTYNSVSMTEMQAAACYNGTSYGTICTDVWYLVAPASGAHTVSVTYHATTDGEEDSVDFTGVNQTTPFSSIQSDTTQNSGASLSVTSKTGDFVLSRITVITGITALCAANSTVQDWQAKSPTFGLWAGVGHAAGASSVTMNWTQSSTSSCPGTGFASEHAHVAFDVAAASSSPTTRNMPAAVY